MELVLSTCKIDPGAPKLITNSDHDDEYLTVSLDPIIPGVVLTICADDHLDGLWSGKKGKC